MHALTFTLEDFKSPERLERLFRRLNQTLAEPPPKPEPLNLQTLAQNIAPLIRTQLQAPGGAPLNLQSLLPTTGLGIVLEDTHANRLALYPASTTATGTLFWETDRTVLYVVEEAAGVRSWQYVSGTMISTFANRPTGLGTDDTGFLLYITTGTAGVVYNHGFIWNGAAWLWNGDRAGIFVDAAIDPGAGYQLCDGTATTYLSVGADLAENAFTTPDENTAPAGVYHESIAAYTGVIDAAAAPGISGSVANTTATNQATTATNQNTVVTAHSVVERSDVAGAGIWVFDAQADADHATHTHTQNSHNHTQDAHNHGVGTLAVDATGEPRRMGVLRFFRR